jgi:hypothetical protein
MNRISTGSGTTTNGIWLIALVTGLCGSATALEANPVALTFEARDVTKTVSLVSEGQPLAAADITGTSFLVENHTYDHMISVKPVEGGIEVTPTDQMEIGSYILQVKTPHGEIAIPVYTPLSDLETSLESRARERGITVEQLKEELGMANRPMGRERVDVIMPSVVYAGKKIIIPMETSQERRYEWTLNGQPLLEGIGPHTLRYTFEEPGLYVFHFNEYEGDTLVASGREVVTVIPEKAVTGAVERDAAVEFLAPEGYAQYNWFVNGEPSGSGYKLACKLREPGLHVIDVEARTPRPGLDDDYRKVVYQILVI